MRSERDKATEFAALGAWCANDDHFVSPVVTTDFREDGHRLSVLNDLARHPSASSRGHLPPSDARAALRTGQQGHQPMSSWTSIEEQSRRSRRTALKEFYKVVDIQEQRRLVKKAESMKSVEKYVALVYPALPLGVSVDRVLWAVSGAVEGGAVYIVQLSPMVAPLFIALTWLAAKYVGAVVALLVAASAVAVLFWAESIVRQRAVLTPPSGALRPVTVGKYAVGKAPPVKGAKAAKPEVTNTETRGASHTSPPESSGRRTLLADLPASQSKAMSSTAGGGGKPDGAVSLQSVIDDVRALVSAIYGTDLPASDMPKSAAEVRRKLERVAADVGLAGPMDDGLAELQQCCTRLRRAVGC